VYRHFITVTTQKAKLLGSRLKQWNRLEKSIKVSFCWKWQSDTATCYSRDGDKGY